MSAPAVVIRKATERDVPAIVELWVEFMDFHMENRTAGSFWRKMGFRPYFEKMHLDLEAPMSDCS